MIFDPYKYKRRVAFNSNAEGLINFGLLIQNASLNISFTMELDGDRPSVWEQSEQKKVCFR